MFLEVQSEVSTVSDDVEKPRHLLVVVHWVLSRPNSAQEILEQLPTLPNKLKPSLMAMISLSMTDLPCLLT